jgi:T-complex protein 1 subunit alpha
MATLFDQPRDGTLFLGGQKISGSDIRDQNVHATQAISNVIKSSFGPSGLDKMMVDDIGVRFLGRAAPPYRPSLPPLTRS